MCKEKRIQLCLSIGAALVLALAVSLYVWWGSVPQLQPEPPVVQSPVQVVQLAQAPPDVREAAAKLSTSRVGYAIVKPDKTYIIISTGSDQLRIAYQKVEGQPAIAAPSFVDLYLSSDAKGDRLLILTTPWGKGVEYQFDLDGQQGAIPALVNPHNLPLVALDETKGFAILNPQPDALAEGNKLRVEGFARAFEAQFDVTIMTAKGRAVGTAHVTAAAGMNNWGSFVAEVTFDPANLPATGMVIFQDQGKPSRVMVPIRFKPQELG